MCLCERAMCNVRETGEQDTFYLTFKNGLINHSKNTLSWYRYWIPRAINNRRHETSGVALQPGSCNYFGVVICYVSAV